MCCLRPILAVGFLLAAASASKAQRPAHPTGMYCGESEVKEMGSLRASGIEGTVVDPAGEEIPRARVKVQVQGSKKLLVDIWADYHRRFRLLLLQPGTYWLGVSAPGFNLHIWELKIVRSLGVVKLRAVLSLGT
ncbi:MAG: carboxypeptidase-like regulatory domain-containing protein [Bryobacteraceae bacterium]